MARRLAEIAAGDRCQHREGFDLVCDDVVDTLRSLQPSSHEQRWLASGNLAVPNPTTTAANNVDQAGLVLEVDEQRSTRSCRALPVGDHSPHPHPNPALQQTQTNRMVRYAERCGRLGLGSMTGRTGRCRNGRSQTRCWWSRSKRSGNTRTEPTASRGSTGGYLSKASESARNVLLGSWPSTAGKAKQGVARSAPRPLTAARLPRRILLAVASTRLNQI